MGRFSRNSARRSMIPYLTSLIYLLSLITSLSGNHHLGSKYEDRDENAPSSSQGIWGRRGAWSEMKTPSSTSHKDDLFPSISDRDSSSFSWRGMDGDRVSSAATTSSLRSGKRNSVQLSFPTEEYKNLEGGQSSSIAEDGRRFYDRARAPDVDVGDTKPKHRTVHGKRNHPSKNFGFGEGRNHGGSTDSRKQKLSSSHGRSPSTSGKALYDRTKGRVRELGTRNSNYYKSVGEGSPPSSSMPRRTVTPNGYTRSRSSSGILSFSKSAGKGRSSDLRNRSYRRQVLDRSYFLPSFEKLSQLEQSLKKEKENAKKAALRDEFRVPSIQQVPKASPLKKKRPNIVLIMTDDLDVELGSLNYMPRLLRLMGGGGALFPNAYTTTPMCCPSRSSMLTGMYIHNHQVFTNHQNCSSPLWQNTHERRSFASYLSKAGYKTAYYGKYLNRYNGSHVPTGWREWAGLIMNSRYYNYTINRNNHLVKYGNRYPYDYYPHVITNDGLRFLRGSKGEQNPFLLVLSYPSPHGPEDSAPEHAHKFFNASDHHTASYNYAPNPDKQWILQFTDRMPAIQLKYTDLLMTKRLQTLQTVDDAIQKIVNTVEEIGETSNTYLFFTSDHGYHLGQFALAKGKSMPFEFDVKVPFLVRGPGVKPGVDLPQIVLNVDLAPTFLDIAGLPRPPQMDGRSLLPILQSSSAPDDAERLQWRDSFLVESSGRLREEEELEKKEQRTWERERALTKTLLEATSALGDNDDASDGSNYDGDSRNKISLYTSKHEKLEVVCQRIEFASPCQRTQKWHCVKIGSRWKIKKCRRSSSSIWHKHCICHFTQGLGTFRKLDVKERRKQRNFLKKYVTKDFHSFDAKFIKYFNNIKVPLHFASTIPRHQSRWANKRRNRRNRYPRSAAEPTRNSTVEFPLSLDFENYTNYFDLHPVDEVLKFEESSEFDMHDHNVTNDSVTSSVSSPQHSPDSLHITNPKSPDTDGREGSGKGMLPTINQEGEQTAEYHPAMTLGAARTDHLVHHFVEEEELRDIKDQIHEITDEIHSLQSVGSTTDPISAVNTTLSVDSSKHGCQATDGHIDCQDEVYENFSAWRNSKVEIEDQIRRLRQQLNVMKNILQHLQTKKPDFYGLYETESYDDFEENGKAENFYDVNISNTYEFEDGNFTAEVGKEIQPENKGFKEEKQEMLHHSVSSNLSEGIKDSRKQLTLPEVGLEIPLVEDVTYSSRNHRKNKHHGRKQNQHYHRKDRKRYDDSIVGKVYYPVSLPTSNDEVSGNESSPSRFCWCDRRALKKMAVQEARERKRQERRKIKEKRSKRQRRKKKKSKSESCNYNSLNCYTHDNDHWKTPPLWTDGQFCFCLNSANNTYWCLRTINDTHNFLYCEFITGLITYYDLHIDPYQLRNVAFTLSNERVLELNEKLTDLRSCKGADECDGWTKRSEEIPERESKLSSSVIQGIPNLQSDLQESFNLDYIDDLSITSPLGRKKMKKLRERQRRKKLKREKKYKNLLKFDGYASGWPEDPFAEMSSLKQSIRIARKSRHSKSGKKQRRREKKRQRRKRRKQKRLSKIRYKKQISPSISANF